MATLMSNLTFFLALKTYMILKPFIFLKEIDRVLSMVTPKHTKVTNMLFIYINLKKKKKYFEKSISRTGTSLRF